jgi:hypothetical protein
MVGEPVVGVHTYLLRIFLPKIKVLFKIVRTTALRGCLDTK